MIHYNIENQNIALNVVVIALIVVNLHLPPNQGSRVVIGFTFIILMNDFIWWCKWCAVKVVTSGRNADALRFSVHWSLYALTFWILSR